MEQQKNLPQKQTQTIQYTFTSEQKAEYPKYSLQALLACVCEREREKNKWEQGKTEEKWRILFHSSIALQQLTQDQQEGFVYSNSIPLHNLHNKAVGLLLTTTNILPFALIWI